MRRDASSAEAPALDGPQPSTEYLVFGAPDIREPEVAEVQATLASGWIGTGPRTHAFERAFGDYVGCANAVALSSCTAALHLAFVLLDLERTAEVIVPALTFAATANAVVQAGATPVFADVDPDTMCVTTDLIAPHVTDRTRAIVPVHFAGRPCPIGDLVRAAGDWGVAVVEDCAHAVGARTPEGHVGMLTTRNRDAAARARRLALHGLSADAWRRFSGSGYVHYDVVEPGFKFNMIDLQAALGLHQLARVDRTLARREAIWSRYDEAFASLPVVRPFRVEPSDRHARHLYTILLDLEAISASRDEVLQALHEEGIGTGVHYRAVHLHTYYRERFGYAPDDFPNANSISERTLSLPLSSRMTDDDVERAIVGLTRALERWTR
jgi:dTDP-4-amino-4,6-dideoxygalactose transaminase